ncbi:hypothetical protein [Bacillus smithii]|uniref:hypothetical protein n=1 Tax=Bacillus smithii TaxID=1479 RepID=UPI003D22A139
MGKHKAIFMGKKVRKIYKFEHNNFLSKYSCWFDNENENQFVDWVEIYKCELDSPPLKEGEEIYIKELDETLYILDRLRSSDGQYIYSTDYIVEIIEDEFTKKSKEEANKKLNKYIEELKIFHKNEIETYRDEIQKFKEKIREKDELIIRLKEKNEDIVRYNWNSINTKKWYQFWKMN